MADYSFATLSPMEFEYLVRDLVGAAHGVRFSSFKAGRDGGVDFRHVDRMGGVTIGQAKHYAGSSISALKSSLRKEVAKVKKLSPATYIVATSLGLTPHDQTEIARMFEGAVDGPIEVLGRDDLNQLIVTVGREVEVSHHKLWLTSTNVMEKVLKSRILNLTDNTMQEIGRKLSRYVENDSFGEALDNLEEHGVCIISGDPGIGKTTLAEVLLAHYVDRGFSPVKVTTTIGEAAEMVLPEGKIAFYYDDFLGRYSLEALMEKNEDQSLLDFIGSVQKRGDRRLIMTTREYILKDAEAKYERLARSDFGGHKYVLDLGKYTLRDRASILLNHLYFSDLDQSYVESLVLSAELHYIVGHRNYNPRVIQEMTTASMLKGTEAEEYPRRFLASLDNPTSVYQHLFDNQLTHSDRSVLYALFSLAPECEIENLERAYCAINSGTPDALPNLPSRRAFEGSLRRLDDTLISTRKVDKTIFVGFRNPSVEEYISKMVSSDRLLAEEIIRHARFFDQCLFVIAPRNSLFPFQIRKAQRVEVDIATLIAALRRTVASELGKLRRFEGSDKCYRERSSLTSRLSTALRGLAGIPDDGVHAFALQLIKGIGEEVRAENCDCTDAVDCLVTVAKSGLAPLEDCDTLQRAVGEFLVTNAQDFNDWEAVVRYVGEFPDGLREYESLTLRQKAEDYAESLPGTSYFPETPHIWSNESELLQELADVLDAELSVWVEYCNERFRELSANEDNAEERERDGWRGSGSERSVPLGRSDIDKMFQPLLEGIRGSIA